MLLIHPFGSPFARHAARALHEAGLIREVVTAFHVPPRWSGRLPQRHWVPEGVCVRSEAPVSEMGRRLLSRSGRGRLPGLTVQGMADRVARRVDRIAGRRIRRHPPRAVFAYEDGAYCAFRSARLAGIPAFLDVPYIHYEASRRILSEEAHREPDLRPALRSCLDRPEKLFRKRLEIERSETIFVASSFAEKTFTQSGVPASGIRRIPFGVDTEAFRPAGREKQKTFRFLFAGRIGPRKGVHHLLEAWKRLRGRPAELWIAGPMEFSSAWIRARGDRVRFLPPVPANRMAEFYREGDCLILPSLAEGFGLVIPEAMACGLPVIATSHTCLPDLSENGEAGWIVPIRDPDALAEAMDRMAGDPYAHRRMGERAIQIARRHDWAVYRENLARSLREILDR